MRVFPQFNDSTDCPICKTNKQEPAILVPLPWTIKGNIAEAIQMHLNCALLVAKSAHLAVDSLADQIER